MLSASDSAAVATPQSLLISFAAWFSLPALVAQVIWGLNTTAMKITVSQLDPYLVGLMRNALSALILFGIVAWREREVGLPRRHWGRLLAMAFVGMGVNSICWQTGLSISTATNAALISNFSPIFALLLAVLLGQERLVGYRVAGLLVALAGVIVIIQADALLGQTAGTEALSNGGGLLGDLLLLIAALAWATYNVASVPLLREHSVFRVTAWAMLLSSAFLAVFSPIGVRNWYVADAAPIAWGGVAYAVILGTVVAHVFWSRAIRNIGASGTMIYGYLNPVLAVLSASLFIGERIAPAQAVGALFVIGGVAISSRPVRSPRLLRHNPEPADQ